MSNSEPESSVVKEARAAAIIAAKRDRFPNAVFLSVMVHYYFMNGEYWERHMCGTIQHESDKMSQSVSDALDFACKQGLLYTPTGIHNAKSYYDITNKGRAYVEGLLTVPFPVQEWVIPPGG